MLLRLLQRRDDDVQRRQYRDDDRRRRQRPGRNDESVKPTHCEGQARTRSPHRTRTPDRQTHVARASRGRIGDRDTRR